MLKKIISILIFSGLLSACTTSVNDSVVIKDGQTVHTMEKIGKRINCPKHVNKKRLYVHPFGVIPYNFNYLHVLTKIKRIFGVKKKSKRTSF